MNHLPSNFPGRHHGFLGRRVGGLWVLATLLLLASARASEPLDTPRPGDDATYRPTVVVRKGSALGTGVIIASIEGESLILTAAHVVEDPGSLYVELFRYNFGWERSGSVVGFPRRWAATIAASDPDSDLAILRVSGQLELPYVARIAGEVEPVALGAAVTSIGFDRGERLIGFPTRVRRFDRVAMEPGASDRPFLITANPPVVGRSGGGLFREDGTLVGVCIARAQIPGQAVVGLYSTVANIRQLLTKDENLSKIVARSHPVVPGPPARRASRRLEPAEINRTGDRLRAN